MIFTYLQCLNDCLDCLVLLSSIKTRFLATVWAVFYILYHIIYSLEIRQLAITQLICYFYDELELAPNFNSAPTPPPPALPLLRKAVMLILRLQAAISITAI